MLDLYTFQRIPNHSMYYPFACMAEFVVYPTENKIETHTHLLYSTRYNVRIAKHVVDVIHFQQKKKQAQHVR